MAIKEADELVHGRSCQSAHEQLAPHRIGAPNQHHLCMESRKVGLRVFHPGEGHLGPYEHGWYHCIHDLWREWCWEIFGWSLRLLIYVQPRGFAGLYAVPRLNDVVLRSWLATLPS